MPYYIKIDFRSDGTLGAWHSRLEPESPAWNRLQLKSTTSKVRVRDVLIALADEIDPIVKKVKKEVKS